MAVQVPQGSRPPKVSIVIATYNRPTVLTAAIRSVIAQALEDWELIVVGDCCDEHTGRTVAAFDDPRIRYVNLPVNCGDQSGPNNAGMAMARGRYIAFLNHDDLWFPDHLSGAVEWLESRQADMVIAKSANIFPSAAYPADPGDWRVRIGGVGRGNRYDPTMTVGPASSLLFKAELVARVGPWRPASECYLTSSQEWLFRVWRSGASIATRPHLTVLIIISRPGSYRRSESLEHDYFEPLLKFPEKLRQLLLDPSRAARPHSRLRRYTVICLRPFLPVIAWVGIAPAEMLGRFGFGYARGAFLEERRKVRGLDPLDAPTAVGGRSRPLLPAQD